MLDIVLLDDGGAYAVEQSLSLAKPYRTTRCEHLALGMHVDVALPNGIESAAIYKIGSPGAKILRDLFESNLSVIPHIPCRLCEMTAEVRLRYQIEAGVDAPRCGPGTHCGSMAHNLDAGYVAWYQGAYRGVKELEFSRSIGPALKMCDACGGDLTKR